MIDYSNCSIDHIIPQFLGGTNNKANLAATCVSCNNKKDRTLLPNHLAFLFYKNNYFPKDIEDFYQHFINKGVLSSKPVDHSVITNSLARYFKNLEDLKFFKSDEIPVNQDEIDFDFLKSYLAFPESLKTDLVISNKINNNGSHKKTMAKKAAIENWIVNHKPIQCWLCSSKTNLDWQLILPVRFFGKETDRNLSILCNSCLIQEQNCFDLSKTRVNELIKTNIQDKNFYPKTAQECLNFFLHKRICNDPELAQSDKNKKRFDDLKNQLNLIYTRGY